MVEKINSFYISGTKNVRPDLFNEFAEKIANSLAKISPNPKNPNQPFRNGVTSTQLRRLFDEVKRYERLIIDDEVKSWESQYPYIKMIKSKVHYATARANTTYGVIGIKVWIFKGEKYSKAEQAPVEAMQL